MTDLTTTTDTAVDSIATAPLQLLLVCPRGEHLETVRQLTNRWPHATHVHWTADPADALRHALTSSLALAIVDARIDRASGRALIRQLGHSHARIDVMSFDDRAAHAQSSWHWSELSRAVTWWLQRHLRPSASVRWQ